MSADILSHDEAAAYLGRSESWLHKLRGSGRGPRFLKLGKRILYRKSDIDAYLEACVVDPEQHYEEVLADTRKKLGIISKEMLACFPDEPTYADPAATYQLWYDDWLTECIEGREHTPESLLAYIQARVRAFLRGSAA